MPGNSHVQLLTGRLEFGEVGLRTEDESYLKRVCLHGILSA